MATGVVRSNYILQGKKIKLMQERQDVLASKGIMGRPARPVEGGKDMKDRADVQAEVGAGSPRRPTFFLVAFAGHQAGERLNWHWLLSIQWQCRQRETRNSGGQSSHCVAAPEV